MASGKMERASVEGANGTLARLDALRRAADLLASSDDPEVAEVGRTLASWRTSGAVAGLDTALGLRRRGGVSLRRAVAIGERDVLLRTLAREHSEYAGLDTAHVAPLMLTAFQRYEAGRWTRDRALMSAPASEPFATFWRLLRGGMTMPGRKHLRAILDREIQYPV